MSETVQVELNKQDRDTLLRGLRFVRRSIQLEMQDPSPEVEANRDAELKRLDALASLLDGVTG